MLSIRRLLWPLGLLLLSGCGFAVRYQIEEEIRSLSAANEDGLPTTGLANKLPPPPPTSSNTSAKSPLEAAGFTTVREPGQTRPDRSPADVAPREAAMPKNNRLQVEVPAEAADGGVRKIVFEQEDKPLGVQQRLFIPKGLPGTDAPEIDFPDDPQEKERYLARLYPPIPPVPPAPPPAPGPEGHSITLADLQRLGETYSPSIKTAFAAVESAKAAAYQAGLYPNPEIAWEHDTVETGPAGYPGGYFNQPIITGGKLTVRQASATMDVLNARLNLRRARSDLWTQIRSNYFAILVALQAIRYYEALFQFAEYLYEYQIKQLRIAKVAAGYEPMQLRPLVLQARFDIIQARNRYAAAWRQLAATLGLPDMPPTELAGSASMPIPAYDYDDVVARLNINTDVRNALVQVQKAKYDLRLAQLTPLPDVGARILVQKDYTTPPNQVAHSAVMYMTVPLWNANQGGIRQAEWRLAQVSNEPNRARLNLINILADAYNRYVVSRQQVDITMEQMSDLVRVYRGAWIRHNLDRREVSFSDLWPIQVTLESYITVFITALAGQWQATVDIADLLQTEDFFNSGRRQDILQLPVLEDLLTPLRDYPPAPIQRDGLPRATSNRQAQKTVASRLCAGIDAVPATIAQAPGTPTLSPPAQAPMPEPSAPANPPALLPQPEIVPRRSEGPAPEP